MIKNLIMKLIGKKIQGETGQLDATSRAKVSFVIYIIITILEQGSSLWGKTIVVPQFVKDLLIGAGLWFTRDAIKS